MKEVEGGEIAQQVKVPATSLMTDTHASGTSEYRLNKTAYKHKH